MTTLLCLDKIDTTCPTFIGGLTKLLKLGHVWEVIYHYVYIITNRYPKLDGNFANVWSTPYSGELGQ